MQEKLKRYKQLSAMDTADQTDEEIQEQVDLYYELYHPKCECGEYLILGHECHFGYWDGRQYLRSWDNLIDREGF
ncbi:MAG: hypothetical protein AUF65_01305 [Chloroflexi bacterium 13_1_20CM_50_12]|nr:MAG: hypothetical protein AUF65_01305 [Chloroflexi bacterium 13_1_20CM_50_12]